MIKIEYLEEEIPVFDITVEGNENFYANGILVHNCVEILLHTKPLQHLYDGAPTKTRIKIKKSDYDEYVKWKKDNPDAAFLIADKEHNA